MVSSLTARANILHSQERFWDLIHISLNSASLHDHCPSEATFNDGPSLMAVSAAFDMHGQSS